MAGFGDLAIRAGAWAALGYDRDRMLAALGVVAIRHDPMAAARSGVQVWELVDEGGRGLFHLRGTSREYVGEWARMLRDRLDAGAARIRVYAALAVTSNGAQTPHLRRIPGISAALETICARLLGLG